MPEKKEIKAAILNEGDTEVERLAAKIVKLPGGGISFIKTYALLTKNQNREAQKKLDGELTPTTNRGFLGIGLVSYAAVSYIEFYSAFKSFTLNKGDEITLFFEDEELAFVFNSVTRPFGYMKRNNCFIPENALQYIAENKLLYWKLLCKQQNLTITGGFDCNEHCNQYKSVKSGQKLLQDMTQAILTLKPQLHK